MTRFNVLLAEDREDDVRAIRRCWPDPPDGTVLNVVHTGRQCIEYLFQGAQSSDSPVLPVPDLLLLDLQMPEMNGFQVLREIKETAGLKRLPVVVLTNSSSEEDIHRAYDLGANAFFVKPAGMKNFAEFLRVCLDYWRAAALPDSRLEDGPTKA